MVSRGGSRLREPGLWSWQICVPVTRKPLLVHGTTCFRDVFQYLQKAMLMMRVQGNFNPLAQTHRLVKRWDYSVGVMELRIKSESPSFVSLL